MIKKLFSGQIESITTAALLIALSSLVSRFLGIFRDRILAGEFGAGDALDVYYAAFRVPDLFFNILVLGALSAGFIPIFSGLIKDPLGRLQSLFYGSPNKEAWALASNVLNLLTAVLLILTAVGFILSPVLTKLLAPGYPAEKQLLVASLTRIMFLSPLILGISSVFGDILQSFKRFFVYSLSPIFYNVGIIIGALYLTPEMGIYGLAWGVVLGALLHLFVQLPTVFSLGYRYSLNFSIKCKNIKKIWLMVPARTMSLAISQINLLVMTVIASTLTSGSLAVFNFANNLQSFPVGIFGISFAVAAFPAFSSMAFDKKKLVENFSRILRQIMFFIVPATILLLALRAQIIRVVLGTGNFSWNDTLLTMDTLKFFTISLFAQALLPLVARVFFARHDSVTPFFVGLASAAVNVILSIIFSRRLGVPGLALAFSISTIISLAVLWVILYFEIGGLDEKKIAWSVLKLCAAAFICAITVQSVKLLVWPYVDMTKTLGVLTQALSAGTAGLIAYFYFSYLFKSEELLNFINSIKRRLPFKKVETGDQGEARGI